VPWGRFTQDPRRPDSAGLRASDQDRAVVLDVLADGYADGRLAKDEYDERAEQTTRSKTLGELSGLIGDLVPVSGARPADDLTLATSDDLHRQAVEAWESHRRRAVAGLLGGASLICWIIWIATSFGRGGFDPHFPWPFFVMMGAGMRAMHVLTHKQEIIAEEQRRLARKQGEAIEARHREP
jgi:hypothetical protein